MGKLFLDITMSLDGFVAGPDQSMDDPLGKGGMQLHDWAFAAEAWRKAHGMEGGDDNLESELIAEKVEATGATIMGRRMFSGGSGAWESDGNATGWWGDEPPFHHDVFVLTHHAREPLAMQGGTTFHFVTDGIESALAQAREAAGAKDVQVAGGAQAAQQYLGLYDHVDIHIAPLLLGGGERLFAAGTTGGLECVRGNVAPSGAVHLRYRPAA